MTVVFYETGFAKEGIILSYAFYRYETEAEKLRRWKLLKVKMLKDQLREARRFADQQREELLDIPGQGRDDREESYAFSSSPVNSDVVEGKPTGTEENAEDAHLFASNGVLRERFDLSDYLAADREFRDESSKRLDEILSRIEGRVPDSDQARAEYDHLHDSIHAILERDTIDMEDRLNMIEQRVNLYIENCNYDNSALDEDLLMDYKALCILLGEDEELVPVEQLKSRVDMMMQEYEARDDREAVADMVNEAMEELGMKVDGCCVLDGQIDGELYSAGGGSKCKVFVSCNASGIMIEPVNVDAGADENVVVDAQRQVCQTERSLIEAVGRSGLVLQKVYSKEHAPWDIATEKDIELDHKPEEKADNRFEQMRGYNRMRRNRQRKQREMTYE